MLIPGDKDKVALVGHLQAAEVLLAVAAHAGLVLPVLRMRAKRNGL